MGLNNHMELFVYRILPKIHVKKMQIVSLRRTYMPIQSGEKEIIQNCFIENISRENEQTLNFSNKNIDKL